MTTYRKPKCPECNNMLYVLGTRTTTTERKGWFCRECNAVYLNKGIKVRKDDLFIGLKKIT